MSSDSPLATQQLLVPQVPYQTWLTEHVHFGLTLSVLVTAEHGPAQSV